jgi:hypothetical protein
MVRFAVVAVRLRRPKPFAGAGWGRIVLLAGCLILPRASFAEEPSPMALFNGLGPYETWVVGKDGQKYTYLHTRKLQLDSKGAVTIVETVKSGAETWTNTFGFKAGDLGDVRVNEREATANEPASLELEFNCNALLGAKDCITSTELATGSEPTPTSSFSLQFAPAARDALERVAAAFKPLASRKSP